MAEFTAALDSALVRDIAVQAAASATSLNPLWQVMLKNPGPPDGETPMAVSEEDPGRRRLIHRALTAPCVAAVAVTPAGPESRREAQISIDGEGAVITVHEQDGLPRWSAAAAEELPGLVTQLVPADSRLAAPASMTTRSPETRLRLEEHQREQLAQALSQGASTQQAIAAITDLDPHWRDALTTDGDRATFAIHYALPTAPEPVTVMRRWTCGDSGLYSADGPAGPLAGMHRVQDGDFFGTVIPLLLEGVQIARSGEAS